MSRRRRRSLTVWLRRSVQLVVLAAFIAAVIATQPVAGEAPADWVRPFFELDPLIWVLGSVAAHALVFLPLLLIVTVVVTLVLGRVFCGWFCPLGTVHALATWCFRRFNPKRRPVEHWSRWQLAKYVTLFGLITLAVCGIQWVVLFDPIVIMVRTTTTALLPALQWAVEDASTAIYQEDPALGDWHLTSITEPVYETIRDHTFVTPGQAFVGSGLVLAFFVLIVGLNVVRPRFWCRYVCPLGGLLGLIAWRPVLTRKVNDDACNQCDLCGMSCHGASTTQPGAGWKPQECFGCLNCTDTCPQDGVRFTLAAPWQRGLDREPVDLGRRELMAGVGAGAAALLFMRTTPQARGTEFNPKLIRPPGARAEPDFLARCIGCGACMRVCPTGGLHPCTTDAGVDGLWTPKLVPKIGYCEYECNACGQVCPTGAIATLSLEDKQAVRIGLARFDTGRCLPYAYGRNCMVCEEHCPVPDKAIYFIETAVTMRDGATTSVLQPRVDPDKCIGCGICENVCPFQDMPAIRVTSANESRHPDARPILPGGGFSYP